MTNRKNGNIREQKAVQKASAEGAAQKLLSQLKKKYAKGKALAQIADEVEEDVESIRPLYDLVVKYPDKTAEELSDMLIRE
ncbi:MAG: hypothetical protein V8Q27_07010 [Eubacteriales bacterium]